MRINKNTINNRDDHRPKQAGFTIIELMIATSVLATVLLLVTVVMISIGTLYYKGIAQSRVQDDTRNVTDEISQQLQTNGQSLATAVWTAKKEQAYCIGNVRYTYVLNAELGHKAPGGAILYKHVLWRDANPTPGSCSIDPADTGNVSSVDLTQNTPSSGGTELIGASTRLTTFCIGTFTSPSTCNQATVSPFPLTISAAYGDDNLLNLNGYKTTCKGVTGEQFCSTARLQTTAVQRL